MRGGHIPDEGEVPSVGTYAQELTCNRKQYASKVYVLVRRDQLRASKVMAKRLLSHPKVEVLWNTAPVEAKGDGVGFRLLVPCPVPDNLNRIFSLTSPSKIPRQASNRICKLMDFSTPSDTSQRRVSFASRWSAITMATSSLSQVPL